MPMASITKVAAFIVSLLLFLSAQPAYADDRSFSISEADIHVQIDSAGDMHVAERFTYHFDGAFNGIIVERDSSKSDGIVDFQAFDVSEEQPVPLQTELSGDGAALAYKIYSQSENETKVFRVTYTVKNVVQVYTDTAELYWKFFDSRNPSPLETVNIHIELPDGVQPEAITAYGHGPLHGVVRVEDDGSVRYQISPQPAGELLEARILFPVAYVPGSTRISADSALEAIQAEEQEWAEQGDDRSVYGALLLLIVNLAGGVHLKFGNIFRRRWPHKYHRELPGDVTPAVVGLLKGYRVKPQELMTTMIDLVRKRRVRMQQVKSGRKDNYTFELLNDGDDGLHPHEAQLIDWFFGAIGKGDKVSLTGIRKYAKTRSNADAFRARWHQWQDEVVEAAIRAGYIRRQGKTRLAVQCVAVAQFFGFWFLAGEYWNWLMFCAIPLFFLIPKKLGRTSAGRIEYDKWKAFTRFLSDYSKIASREPMAVHLWEHYFVYAIPLGAAKKMNAIARLKVPGAEQDRHYIDASYIYYYDSLKDSFEKAVKTTHQSDSSDSSSGGSFSSGGGGGGGGGGNSAF